MNGTTADLDTRLDYQAGVSLGVTIHRRFWPQANDYLRHIKAPHNATRQPGPRHDHSGTMLIRAAEHHLEGLIDYLPEEAVVSRIYPFTATVMERLQEAA